MLLFLFLFLKFRGFFFFHCDQSDFSLKSFLFHHSINFSTSLHQQLGHYVCVVLMEGSDSCFILSFFWCVLLLRDDNLSVISLKIFCKNLFFLPESTFFFFLRLVSFTFYTIFYKWFLLNDVDIIITITDVTLCLYFSCF